MTGEELQEYGIERMDPAAVDGFLRSQNSGVLGLPADTPYLIPLSYGYEQGSVFFTFLEGEGSRKSELARQAGRAAFLVYSVDSAFSWQSVQLAGPLRKLSADEWSDATEVLDSAWRPAAFEDAEFEIGVEIYELSVEKQTGLRHTGLPPGMRS